MEANLVKQVIYEFTGLGKDDIKDISTVALPALHLVKVKTVGGEDLFFVIPAHPLADVETLVSMTEQVDFEKII